MRAVRVVLILFTVLLAIAAAAVLLDASAQEAGSQTAAVQQPQVDMNAVIVVVHNYRKVAAFMYVRVHGDLVILGPVPPDSSALFPLPSASFPDSTFQIAQVLESGSYKETPEFHRQPGHPTLVFYQIGRPPAPDGRPQS